MSKLSNQVRKTNIKKKYSLISETWPEHCFKAG